jgi:6-phosphogluconolactonase
MALTRIYRKGRKPMTLTGRSLVWTLALVVCGSMALQAMGDEMLVYIGSYTGPRSKGIYVSRLDTASGKLGAPEVAAEMKNPSFLAIAPDGKHLYAIGEVDQFKGQKAGGVAAYTIDAGSGKLTLLNEQSTGGPGPAHVSVDHTGKVVMVANYGGGSVESLPVKEDGSLGEPASFFQHEGSSADPARQKEPHAHSIYATPDNKYAVSADLGLDKLMIYRLDAASGKMTANDPPFAKTPAGGGPRHVAFSPDAKFAYIVNEMGCSVTVMSYDGTRGALAEVQTINALPEGVTKTNKLSGAEVAVHPSGKFVYASMRGLDVISIFAVDQASGKLTAAGHVASGGKTPRAFGIDPSGKFLLVANQDSGNVVVMKIDEQTGGLTATGSSIEVGSACSVEFVTKK